MTCPLPLAAIDVTSSIIVWSLVLICVIIAGLAIALQVKKKVTETGTTSDSGGGGFTLSDLRKMVKDGNLTPDEFEKARVKIVEAARRASEREKPK